MWTKIAFFAARLTSDIPLKRLHDLIEATVRYSTEMVVAGPWLGVLVYKLAAL